MEKINFGDIKVGNCIAEDDSNGGKFFYLYIVEKLDENNVAYTKTFLYVDKNFNILKILGNEDKLMSNGGGKIWWKTFKLSEEEKMKYYTKPLMLKEME